MKNETCIFCKIIKKEIPHNKIYEDKNVIAFLDAFPVNKGHTLILPKKHFKNIYEIPEKTLWEVMKLAKKLSITIKKTMKADGINVYMNNEEAAGQVIDHLHVHIIPRIKGDGYGYWKNKKSYTDKEMSQVTKKIIRAL